MDEFDDPDSKACELPSCGELFTRASNVSRREFGKRRFHTRACAEAFKRSNGGHRASAAPVVVRGFRARYNAEGVWRPNAPGWPDFPRIPSVDVSTHGAVGSST